MLKEYKMTEEQYQAMIEAHKNQPPLGFSGYRVPAMGAWENLAKELNFEIMTAAPCPDKDDHYFLARPLEN